jgi:hypothetical protein
MQPRQALALAGALIASVLTEASALGQVIYQIDNGVPNDDIGFNGTGTYDFIWLNSFPIVAGGEKITDVSVAFSGTGNSQASTYNGLPISIVLYQGSTQALATLLMEEPEVISGAGTNVPTDYSIPPTVVSGSMLVGVVAKDIPRGASYLAGLDTTGAYPNRSFIGDTLPGDTMNEADLASIPAGQFGTIDSFGIPGDLVIRATGVATVPEPGSLSLLAFGACTGIWMCRRARDVKTSTTAL